MRNKHQILGAAAVFALGFLAADTAQAALSFGTNLIQNPGAELSAGGTTNTNSGLQAVPNWVTTGNFSVVQYSNIPMSVPQTTDPGPAVRGSNFFAGGIIPNPDAPTTLAIGDQLQDVSNVASLIDAGLVPYTLSAYLGGYFDQRDNAMLTAIFEDGSLATLGSTTIGPVTVTDRNSTTGLFFRSAMGTIPMGTRNIDFRLVLTGIDGHQNDGYADNLSFIATNGRGPAGVPEPGTIGMMAVGICGVGLGLRRRKRKG